MYTTYDTKMRTLYKCNTISPYTTNCCHLCVQIVFYTKTLYTDHVEMFIQIFNYNRSEGLPVHILDYVYSAMTRLSEIQLQNLNDKEILSHLGKAMKTQLLKSIWVKNCLHTWGLQKSKLE